MTMLRGGTASLMIESGRWQGLPREKRRCRECHLGKIENVPHWLLACDAWCTERPSPVTCTGGVLSMPKLAQLHTNVHKHIGALCNLHCVVVVSIFYI